MAEQNLVIICKNCEQKITYFNKNVFDEYAIICPKCACTLDSEGNILTKPIIPNNVQDEIKRFSEEHDQLHLSCDINEYDNYFDFEKCSERHEKIIKELETRNSFHKCREDFLDDYYKFNHSELINDETIKISEVLQYLKSFKLKDPFIYSINDNSLMVNATRDEIEKTQFLKVALFKVLKLLPRRYWGTLKFLENAQDIDLQLNAKRIFELNCTRILNENYIESAYHSNNDFIKAAVNVKNESLDSAQYTKTVNQLTINKFFLHLVDQDQHYDTANLITSNFIEQDYPLYVTKREFGLRCQIHKDGEDILVYTQNGVDISKNIPNIVDTVRTLTVDTAIMLGVIELNRTQTDGDDILAYLNTEHKDKDIVCNINDVLYFEKDIHNQIFSERKKFLDLLCIKQSTFDVKKANYCLNKTPYLMCKKRDELEKALSILKTSQQNTGVIIRIDMPYSLMYNQPGLYTYNTEVKKDGNVIVTKDNVANNETLIFCDFLNCEIKDIYINITRVPYVEAGNIFNATQELTKKFTLVETRNFSSYEIPPIYQEISLKKNLARVFLIEGTQFYYDDVKNMPLIIQRYPVYGGYLVKFITTVNECEFNTELVKHISLYAKENNFLKGEKFSVSGIFLDDQTATWDDLKLSNNIKDKLKKLESLISKDDPTIESRGLIFIGPPGCGKTLSGKILSKMAPTFIWITTKDFSDMSPTYAVSTGFDLARNLRPSILFIEDIDSYIEYGLVDLLKTELDGMKLNNGVFTIVTSNFPERLPEALIDRPGRFHDILYFALPNKEVRKEMILHFLKEEVDGNTLETILQHTDGFSGAHMKEVCRFAQIIQKEDNLSLTQALLKSLEKLIEQRKLIRDIKSKNQN